MRCLFSFIAFRELFIVRCVIQKAIDIYCVLSHSIVNHFLIRANSIFINID